MVAWGKDREKGFSMTECIQWAGPKMKYAWYHENRALFGISVRVKKAELQSCINNLDIVA